MRRFLFFLVLLLLIGGGIYAFIQNSPGSGDSEKNRIRTDTAQRRDIESVVTATGEVLPLLNSVVKSEVGGRVEKILIEEGSRVTKDEELVELDRASVAARVREAKNNVETEKHRVEQAERHFEKRERLHKGGFLGEEEYLDARTDLEVAELNLRNAEARLEEHLEDLSKTVIRAPHDGMVTRLDVVEGEVISGVSSTSQGTEVLTVAELDELYMEADINEVDVELFETGDVARLSFDALQELEVEGSIDTISSSARKDGEVRVFPIEIVFDAPDAGIRPGISATAEIPVAAEDDVVSVLLSTVFKGEDGSYVYLKRADGWDRRSVETGINNLQHVAILSGLEVGDEVALRRPKNHRNE